MAAIPTGTVTFLFTDIEGSTRLAHALGERWPALLERHQALLREAFHANDGVEIATEGDSFFVVFRAVPPAIAAVAAAQRALASEAWPSEAPVRVRMGLHTGVGSLGGDNYVGIDVHRAARIAGAAHGGQVVLSAATRELAAGALPEGVGIRDLGEHRLKDLAEPERLAQLVIDGLPADFPRLRSLSPTNLPPELTSFVGRAREVDQVGGLLDASRIVTLTGPGGTGKTRLALRVAGDARDRFPDGVFFVALEPLRDPDLLPSAVAQVLGVAETPGRSIRDSLVDHLRDRQLLLVLDNFEQLSAAAPLVAGLVAAAPRLSVVTTSREALHISGEQEYPVPPLGLPDPRATANAIALTQYEAVALFIARARAVRPDFSVTNENAPAVAEITARLDGLPLAIELAAARTKLLSPQAILARLGSRLELLSSGAVDLTDRQRTLRGAIAWSYDLLDEPERRLFSRFSVFAGGAALEALEQVVAQGLGGDLLELVAGLVDKSLLRPADADAGGEPRFAMLQTIRDYAAEELVKSGESDDLALRHAAFFRDRAERWEPELTGVDQLSWLARWDRDIDNVRAALRFSVERDEAETGLRTAAALWRFFHQRSHLAEGRDWFDRLLALPSAKVASVARFRALIGLGGIAYWQADYGPARRAYEDALAIGRELGDRRLIADAGFNIAYLDYRDGDFGAVDRHAGEARAIYEEVGDRAAAARAGNFLSLALFRSGDYEGARRNATEARDVMRALGRHYEASDVNGLIALSLNRLGDYEGARRLLLEALGEFEAIGNVPNISAVLDLFAVVEADHGEFARALRIVGASDALREREGGLLSSLEILRLENPRVTASRTMATDDVERLYAEGRAMSLEEALAYVRQSTGESLAAG